MTEPVWLDLRSVLIFHEEVLADHGGDTGVRDRGLLESGVARARNAFAYDETDICMLAALYAAGVVRNHPFVDGNKRTGFLCAIVFLDLNGYHFSASEADVVTMTLGLAAGEVDEIGYAECLREWAAPA